MKAFLILGELMFPSNPHAALWHKTALKCMMNTLCTAADTNDTSLVDGREVKDWVLGANLSDLSVAIWGTPLSGSGGVG